MKDSSLSASGDRDISALVTDGIQYLDKRADFWRQQKPIYARRSEQKQQALHSHGRPAKYVGVRTGVLSGFLVCTCFLKLVCKVNFLFHTHAIICKAIHAACVISLLLCNRLDVFLVLLVITFLSETLIPQLLRAFAQRGGPQRPDKRHVFCIHC